MNKKYTDERFGQKEFLESYLQRVDKNLSVKDVLADYSDGVINGNLLEFKLNINDLNYVLFQTVKILSSMRIKGKSIPKNIFLISLNTNDIYKYDSEEYIEYIEKVYTMGASKDNTGFQGNSPIKKYNLKNELDESNFINDLKTNNYTKVNIDDNCIVGWATRFYRENPSSKKSDFIGDQEGKVKIIGEIRNPTKFKDFINKYKGDTNIKFQYLMDKLNDDLQKKILGAFYTPELYAKKSIELLREAIKKVPKGNDYIILDRCAGTGNLEQYLTDEELSHTVVSTIEYYEYKVLAEVLGDKVREIIPPTEKEDTFNMGLVRGADALSEEYINNPVIKKYLEDKKCTIIIFENPPYAETTSIEHQKQGKGKTNSVWKKSFVVEEMKKEVKGTVSNDLGNAFIWSAFKYYLRQDTDSYIVYSPVKYWKAHHLINKNFLGGFAFNRKHFHTNTNACIMCALWSNENENLEEIEIQAYDIVEDEDKNKILKDDGILKIKRVHTMFSEKYYDKRKFDNDKEEGIVANINGKEELNKTEKQISLSKKNNENILGYLIAQSTGFDLARKVTVLTRNGIYNAHGFFLRSDNYLEKLPMFVAGKYTDNFNNWTIMSQVMKSGDKAKEYEKDVKSGKLNEWLLKCLFWTSLTNQSHMRSLIGSDKRFYKNELCLDNTNGETLASKDLKKMKIDKNEENILVQWEKVLVLAKETKNYNPKFSYGLYQIEEELNTYHKDTDTDTNEYDYPELNGSIKTLKDMLKKYYNSELVSNLFKYELLK